MPLSTRVFCSGPHVRRASMPQAGSLRYHDDCVGENVGKYVSLTRPLPAVSFCISAYLSLKVTAILYF